MNPKEYANYLEHHALDCNKDTAKSLREIATWIRKTVPQSLLFTPTFMSVLCERHGRLLSECMICNKEGKLKMKLYEVNLERKIYVVAKSQKEAEHIAELNEHYELDSPDFVNAVEVTKVSRISQDWRDCFPYGQNKDYKTCEQIINEQI